MLRMALEVEPTHSKDKNRRITSAYVRTSGAQHTTAHTPFPARKQFLILRLFMKESSEYTSELKASSVPEGMSMKRRNGDSVLSTPRQLDRVVDHSSWRRVPGWREREKRGREKCRVSQMLTTWVLWSCDRGCVGG